MKMMEFCLKALMCFSLLVLSEQVPADYNGERCTPSKKCSPGYCCRRLSPMDSQGYCLPTIKENKKCFTSFLDMHLSCGCGEGLMCTLNEAKQKHLCTKIEDEALERSRKRALYKKK